MRGSQLTGNHQPPANNCGSISIIVHVAPHARIVFRVKFQRCLDHVCKKIVENIFSTPIICHLFFSAADIGRPQLRAAAEARDANASVARALQDEFKRHRAQHAKVLVGGSALWIEWNRCVLRGGKCEWGRGRQKMRVNRNECLHLQCLG